MVKKTEQLRHRLLGMSRQRKRVLQVVIDVLLIWLALWLAFFVRLGFTRLIDPFDEYLWLFIAAPATTIPLFIRFGLYRAVLRYFGGRAFVTIFNAISLSALLLALVIYLVRPDAVMPRSVVVIYWALAMILAGGLRLFLRRFFIGELFPARLNRRAENLPRVAIYGAGSAGNQLLAALRLGRRMVPVAFVDDDPSLSDRIIDGIRVYRSDQIARMISDTDAQEVLLAIPSVSRARRREILASLEPYSVHVRTVPGFMDIATGRISVADLQEVDIVDLLERDPVPPRAGLLERCIRSQAVMVTGAGGSIGSELSRQILGSSPSVLVLFEHSEYNLYQIQRELEQRIARDNLSVRLIGILGSVRDGKRLQHIMQSWHVQTLYHAAAYKHVPIVEHNVAEGVLNNVDGTLRAAQAAIRAGVANFVLISTDKAVRPTNVMGSTKRLAEMVLQALSAEKHPVLLGEDEPTTSRTHFTMVRFGNVLGSSGSVIPVFREQIKRGGPVTVTHPNITRYFMTITEAAQLVIQAGAMGEGGDVFVLDMGEPVKIAEMAEKMIHLSGLSVRSKANPNGDIEILFTGLRPGEKLYEELLIGENVVATEHPMIMRASEEMLPWAQLKQVLQSLLDAVGKEDVVAIRNILKQAVSGYVPDAAIVDWCHQQRRSLKNFKIGI